LLLFELFMPSGGCLVTETGFYFPSLMTRSGLFEQQKVNDGVFWAKR
jgi:hypothetical protein